MGDNNPVESWVYDNLPIELKRVTDLFVGREKDIVLYSSLGVLSGCLPNISAIYDNKKVYSNLYIVIVAPPASGKGSMKFSRYIAEKIDNKLHNITIEKNAELEKNKAKGKVVEKFPQLMKFSPGNISSSEFYTHLKNNELGLIIFESEIDTVNNVMKNEWGNYSDLLRKAFHHETLSISRKNEGVFLKIENPKLSVVLSGTLDQLYNLVGSVQNGLFSRLGIYYFDEAQEFKNVFASNEIDFSNEFRSLGEEVYNTYKILKDLQNEILFEFTQNQKNEFISQMSVGSRNINETIREEVNSVFNRHALTAFRMAMVLTAFRKRESLVNSTSIICDDVDYKIAMHLAKVLLNHSIFLLNSESNNLTEIDENLFENLTENFTRKIAITTGENLGIPIRTIDDKLKQFVKKGLIKSIKQGHYKKI